ncbi:hypothetical protein F5Y15DRAFT_414244 [Xylariaceae sp. FL0016]|nr:hypothetical protein F5Y15DRAFT_414244 [Xylariaceae sp. FL0016]
MRSKMLLAALRLPGHGRCGGTGDGNGAAADTDAESRLSHEEALRGRVYIDFLPSDIEPIRKLLEKYSGIRAKDIDEHIHSMRDRLWEIYPYACIGQFRFLSLQFTHDLRYQAALKRLLSCKARAATFLDLGCCVGQVLRQLAYDGVDSARLYGTDIEPRFFDAGYDLFRDRDKLRATFVAGDLLASSSSSSSSSSSPSSSPNGEDESEKDGLDALDGRMTFIHATSFFHLFTWDEQVLAATRMARFLDPDDADAMIFGRQVGTSVPGARVGPRGDAVYLHSAETWQQLWDEVGRRTGTAWRTQVDLMEDTRRTSASGSGRGADDTLRRVRFGVYRA